MEKIEREILLSYSIAELKVLNEVLKQYPSLIGAFSINARVIKNLEKVYESLENMPAEKELLNIK